MAEKQGIKLCKHCKMEIPKGVKVCPNCRKKQGGALKWVIIGIVVLAIIGNLSDKKDNSNSDNNASSSTSTENSNSRQESAATEKPTPEPTMEPVQKVEITLEEIKEQAQELVYKDVMRNPDNYVGQYFCVTVKILTVENGSFFSGYDKAYKAYTNDEYDLWFGDMIYLLDNRDAGSGEYIKILEGDIITVYGRFDSLVETKNALNGTKGEEMSLQILYAELISE